jgi:hypothetical protein
MNISAKMRKPEALCTTRLSGAIELNKPFIFQLMRVSVVVTLICNHFPGIAGYYHQGPKYALGYGYCRPAGRKSGQWSQKNRATNLASLLLPQGGH